MPFWAAFGAVAALSAAAMAASAVPAFRPVIGIWLPYAAIVIFLAGFARRTWLWARAPVPFRIPTTAGQQRSLGWVKPGRLESPSSTTGVVGRMALEVLLFRSLFRNNQPELRPGPRVTHAEAKWLWLGALAFHWSLAIVVLRHLRFFLEPVPTFVTALARVDGFFEIGVPEVFVTDVGIAAALAYLLTRRLRDPLLRYLSQFSDHFALLLLGAIVTTGLLLRHLTKTDLPAVKASALGLVTFAPAVPANAGTVFFAHLALVAVLLAYFPFSKLLHAPGVLLSPTRNQANDSRGRRHVNPWNAPVPVHGYAEWEDEFREKMRASGLPLEKG
jgi:nitrate reductase gamma subunit